MAGAQDDISLTRGRPPRHTRHDDAVLRAEVLTLVRELRAAGPLTRSTLAVRCHASRWRGGSFEAALQAGFRDGALRQLPFDFIAAGWPTRDTDGRLRAD